MPSLAELFITRAPATVQPMRSPLKWGRRSVVPGNALPTPSASPAQSSLPADFRERFEAMAKSALESKMMSAAGLAAVSFGYGAGCRITVDLGKTKTARDASALDKEAFEQYGASIARTYDPSGKVRISASGGHIDIESDDLAALALSLGLPLASEPA